MTATADHMAERIADHLGEDFLTQVFRHRHHLIRHAVPTPSALIDWDTLNRILATHRLEPPRLRLSHNGETLPPHRYTIPRVTRRHQVWHQIQPGELHQRLAEGATLVLDAVDELHPPIAELAETVEWLLRTGVQVNLYASWTSQEGFGLHWDDHDVIVVQIDGTKRWRLYGPTRSHPTYRDVAQPQPPRGDAIEELVLNPGDVLYVPRGHWHQVTAFDGGHSLHLTCGLQTITGADLIGYLADQLRATDVVRADLPQFDPHAQDAYQALLRAEVCALLEQPGLIERFFTHRDVTDAGRLTPSLPYVRDIPADPQLMVRLIPSRAHLDVEQGAVRLRAAGNDWQFAPEAWPVLEALLPGRPVSLGDLARVAALPVSQVAGLIGELVSHQVAAIEHRSSR